MGGTEVSEFIDLAYIWQERATKAEAKLDRLIEGCMRCAGEDDHERFQRLRAEVERLQGENARLRRVAEAARIAVDNAGRVRVGQNPVYDLRQALAELDKEG
jgi:endonuclease YncB( thermonuclease family)